MGSIRNTEAYRYCLSRSQSRTEVSCLACKVGLFSETWDQKESATELGTSTVVFTPAIALLVINSVTPATKESNQLTLKKGRLWISGYASVSSPIYTLHTIHINIPLHTCWVLHLCFVCYIPQVFSIFKNSLKINRRNPFYKPIQPWKTKHPRVGWFPFAIIGISLGAKTLLLVVICWTLG